MTLQRLGCILDESDPILPVRTIKSFPVFMGTIADLPQNDQFLDMKFGVSKKNGIVQLMEIPDFADVYPKQTTTSAMGGLWKLHHEEFAKFLSGFNPSSVLEIGGAHGYLSYVYAKKYGFVDWTIVEPNPRPVLNCPARFIEGFLEEVDLDFSKFDLIVHSHTLEHVINPLKWLKIMSQKFSAKQRMIFSIPRLDLWLRSGYSNALNFEHSFLLDNEVLRMLLKKSDFHITHSEHFMSNHSNFVCATKIANDVSTDFVDSITHTVGQLQYLNAFFDSKTSFVEHANDSISSGNNRVFCFGAHIFTQLLLKLGLKENAIEKVLDNDSQKWGQRLYGTKLLVESPQQLKYEQRPIVVVDAGSHTSEIVRELKQINETCMIISPLFSK